MRRFIITGAPGAGKTAIIRQLELDGFSVVEEAATDVIAAAQARGIAEPWTDPRSAFSSPTCKGNVKFARRISRTRFSFMTGRWSAPLRWLPILGNRTLLRSRESWSASRAKTFFRTAFSSYETSASSKQPRRGASALMMPCASSAFMKRLTGATDSISSGSRRGCARSVSAIKAAVG